MKHTLVHALRRYWFDIAVVLALGGALLEASLNRSGDDAPDMPLALLLLALLPLFLPLLARRRFPFGAPVAVFVYAAVISFVDGSVVTLTFFAFVLVIAAVFLMGLLPDRRQALAGLAAAGAAATIVNWRDPNAAGGDYIFIPLVFALSWLAAFALGRKLLRAVEAEERAARLEQDRERDARVAVAEERARIARELHDIVGHAVSVMVVQAGGVRRLLEPHQEREREALQTIEETGRQALTEMRRMLGMLRGANAPPELAPQPGLETIASLVEQVRKAGLPVDLRVEGDSYDVAPSVDLAAYRVVQESLTNALRHAGPARAEVVVRYADEGLELEVSNDGRFDQNGDVGGGEGLAGMRERVSFCGGTVESGPRADGSGFCVRARIPLPNESAI